MRISIKGHFDAAHMLSGYDGACANLHGHRWNVKVVLNQIDPALTNGIWVDFKDLKRELDQILKVYDHKFLCNSNDPVQVEISKNAGASLMLDVNTSAENIVKLIWDDIRIEFNQVFKDKCLYTQLAVYLYETPDNGVAYDGSQG